MKEAFRPLIPACANGHRRKPWSGIAKHPGEIRNGRARSGLVCVNCSKTWEWINNELVPTYPETSGE